MKCIAYEDHGILTVETPDHDISMDIEVKTGLILDIAVLDSVSIDELYSFMLKARARYRKYTKSSAADIFRN